MQSYVYVLDETSLLTTNGVEKVWKVKYLNYLLQLSPISLTLDSVDNLNGVPF